MRYGQPRPHGADLGEDAMRDEVKTFTQSEIIALLKIFITSSAIQAAAVEEALDWFDARRKAGQYTTEPPPLDESPSR